MVWLVAVWRAARLYVVVNRMVANPTLSVNGLVSFEALLAELVPFFRLPRVFDVITHAQTLLRLLHCCSDMLIHLQLDGS